MDREGRAVIKKEILEKAGIETPCTMLVSVKPDGAIELKKIDDRLTRAAAIGSKKLKGWREDNHAGEKLLFKMVKHKAD